MGRKKPRIRASKIPPPSLGQVAWLLGGGLLWLAAFLLLSYYERQIAARETLGQWDEAIQTAYGIVFIAGIVGGGALLLGIWKAISLLRLRIRSGKAPGSKKGKRKA